MSSSRSEINQSLLKTKIIETQQQQIRQKARQLKQKLEQAKLKKQLQMEKVIRQRMIAHYQTHFDFFKQQIEQQFKSQCCSLELIKEFKLGEVVDLEKIVEEATRYLENSLKQTAQMEAELKDKYEDALEFIDAEMEKEKEKNRLQLEEVKNKKIQEYTNSIYIQ